jgi:hypothetical protein
MGYAYEKHVPSRAEIVVGIAADAIRRWADRGEFVKFARDNPSEADRLAQDLSVDKATLLAVAGRSNGPPALLNRRLRVLGIDPKALQKREPAVARDLARCCALCNSQSRCARDLARQPDNASWQTYCPNEPTLTALRPSQAALSAAT